jgi:hypothetical protein
LPRTRSVPKPVTAEYGGAVLFPPLAPASDAPMRRKDPPKRPPQSQLSFTPKKHVLKNKYLTPLSHGCQTSLLALPSNSALGHQPREFDRRYMPCAGSTAGCEREIDVHAQLSMVGFDNAAAAKYRRGHTQMASSN